MNEEVQTISVATTTSPSEVIPSSVTDIEVSAVDPIGMEQSQSALIKWAKRKIEITKVEHAEVQGAYEHAVKMRWRRDVLKKQAESILKRVQFYEKVLTALEMGYVIVPQFPVDLFAVRTDKKNVTRVILTREVSSGVPWRGTFQQATKNLPEGQGQYQNPFPTVRQSWARKIKDDQGREKEVRDFWSDEWDEMEFPVAMSRPVIMQSVTRAMAQKVFDEIGIFQGGADPIIVGSIVNPKRGMAIKYCPRVMFMLAWSLNTSDL